MPMAINNVEEYEKVVNVSWFTPEKPAEELRYLFSSADPSASFATNIDLFQLPMRSSVLPDVPTVLYRYKEFPQSVLFLLG